ncbi:MAG: acetyl-CoA carboxylase biotin carboxylase subunit family protein [Roseovarius sp.]
MNPRLVLMRMARRLARSEMLTSAYARLLELRARLFLSRSSGPVVAILSLGKNGHSYSAARAARALGLKVVMVSPEPVLAELAYSNYLVRLNPLDDTSEVIERLRPLQVQAALISVKHLILPAQIKVAEALGLVSSGQKASDLANDKLAWRKAMEAAGLTQQAYSESYSDLRDRPVVRKPRSGTSSIGVFYLEPGSDAEIQRIQSDGQPDLFEEYVDGEQFDVEGFSRDGVHHTLTIVKEKYKRTGNEFPPKYFHFNPAHDAAFLKMAEEKAFQVLDASGIRNGAWHVEMRHLDGDFMPLDFANRMGYERFITRSSGVDFGQQHVAAFIPGLEIPFERKPRRMVQYFATEKEEYEIFKRIVEEHPSSVFDARMEPFRMSTMLYYGMIVVEAETNEKLFEMLHGLTFEV